MSAEIISYIIVGCIIVGVTILGIIVKLRERKDIKINMSVQDIVEDISIKRSKSNTDTFRIKKELHERDIIEFNEELNRRREIVKHSVRI